VQSVVMASGLESLTDPLGRPLVVHPGWGFRVTTAITLTTGTAFLMWLGERITERGIGNGISLIIFAGIAARVPAALTNTYSAVESGEIQPFSLFLVGGFMIVVLFFIVWFERAHRRIPIQYPQRVMGRRLVQGQSSFLPLRLNTSGVIPPIFASSLLFFIPTIAQFTQEVQAPAEGAPPSEQWYFRFASGLNHIAGYFQPGGGYYVYELLYGVLIVLFAYFYTAVTFDPVDVADNLRKNGGFVPGIRPGQRTAEYIDTILSRLTLIGSLYLVIVCLLPSFLSQGAGVPFYFGGTSLLIVVGVALDTAQQIESHMISRNYEGFFGSKKSLRGQPRRRMA
ncbi:MAG: preprotein translocase subunit SecY, partial [Bdellovibrionota bacterium]